MNELTRRGRSILDFARDFGLRATIELLVVPKFVDGGANVGYSSTLFANQHPDATILALEPEPTNFEMLQRHCGPSERIRCFRAALWPRHRAVTATNPDALHDAFQVRRCLLLWPADTRGSSKEEIGRAHV